MQANRPPAREVDPYDGQVRLSKLMSERGLSSRREADEWIEHGWVRVNGEVVSELRGAAIDEEGNLLLEIPAGIALLCDRDLPTLLPCLHLANGEVADDDALLAAIAQAAGGLNADISTLTLVWQAQHLPVRTLQRSDIPKRYGFIASPQEAPPRVLP